MRMMLRRVKRTFMTTRAAGLGVEEERSANELHNPRLVTERPAAA
jgi:hypothetical protein